MKIVFLSHLDMNLYLFRLSWMKALLEEGHEVLAVVPKGKYFDRFGEHGIKAVEWRMRRGSVNPVSVVAAIFGLRRILSNIGCSVMHAFTLQVSVIGSLAAVFTGVPRVFLHITGLGYAYTGEGVRAALTRSVITPLAQFSFKRAHKVVFQNPDDMKELESICPAEKAVLIKGTGVDIERFSPGINDDGELDALRKELGVSKGAVVITFVGRLLRHKGIEELVEAAGLLQGKMDGLVFLIVGWADAKNPAVVSREFIEKAGRSEALRFLGEREDIRNIMALTDIYCLPSYREGTPRTVLEAMAMAKPVVTTDVPGCRQTVEDGVNGYLVPSRDPEALAKAIERLSKDKGLRERMGKAGREKVVREFSDRVVTDQVKALYETFL